MEPDKSKESVVQIDRHDIMVPPVGLDGILALPVPSRAVIVLPMAAAAVG